VKVHLIISIDPIPNGKDLEAICGEVVPKAQAIPLSEFPDHPQRSTVAFCKKCFGRQYFYAITGGQEAHDAEGSD